MQQTDNYSNDLQILKSQINVITYLRNFEKNTVLFYKTNFSYLIPPTIDLSLEIEEIDANRLFDYQIENHNNQKKLFDDISITIDNMLNKYKAKIQSTKNKSEWWLYSKIIDILENQLSLDNDISYSTCQRTLKYLEEIKPVTEDIGILEIIREIDYLVNLLEMVCPNHFILGMYSKKNRTIYICSENIQKSITNQIDLSFESLLESVFIHEYAHFLHFENIIQKQNPLKTSIAIIQRNAVFETIAEYCQIKHALYTKNTSLMDWIHNHKNFALFPGWGYNGASIIETTETKFNIRLFDTLVSKSFMNWYDAYSIIEHSRVMNKLPTLDSQKVSL